MPSHTFLHRVVTRKICTFTVTVAPAWHTLHIHLFRLSPEFVCKPGVAACSQSPLWLVFQLSLIGYTDSAGSRWLCLSPHQASQTPLCLHAPVHQILTGIPLPTSISIRLLSCSPVSSAASVVFKIFCLQPQSEWMIAQQLAWFCKEEKKIQVLDSRAKIWLRIMFNNVSE